MQKHEAGWWMVENVSAQPYGQQVDDLMVWLHLAMLVLFIGWVTFYLLALLKFRARKGHQAKKTYHFGKVNLGLALAVAVFEIGLEMGIAVPGWRNLKSEFPNPNEAVNVRVIGKQFAWIFHYPGRDRIFGKAKAELADASNPMGLDREGDPAAKDDVWTYGVMRVPIGEPVIARISSLDVIHSFGVANLRLKQDAIPGMEVPIWFEGAVEGRFDVACSQLCGNGHSSMKGTVWVMDPAGYQQWLDEQHAELGL